MLTVKMWMKSHEIAFPTCCRLRCKWKVLEDTSEGKPATISLTHTLKALQLAGIHPGQVMRRINLGHLEQGSNRFGGLPRFRSRVNCSGEPSP